MIYMNVLTCCSLRYHWRSTYFRMYSNLQSVTFGSTMWWNWNTVARWQGEGTYMYNVHVHVPLSLLCLVIFWFLDIHIIKLIHNFNHMFSMYISRYSPSPSAISPWWGRSPPPPPLQGRLPWAASRWLPPPSSGSNCHQNHRRPDFYPSGFLDLNNDTPRLVPCYNHNMAR